MATPTIIGTNTWPVRLSDVISDATDPGHFAWYLKGFRSESWDNGLLGTVVAGGDTAKATTNDSFKWTMVIKDVKVKTKAQMDLIKRAFRCWSAGNDSLYLWNKLDGTDEGYWANAAFTAADLRIKVKIAKISVKSMIKDVRIIDIFLIRVT